MSCGDSVGDRASSDALKICGTHADGRRGMEDGAGGTGSGGSCADRARHGVRGQGEQPCPNGAHSPEPSITPVGDSN
jgi:hypothetical protein